MTPDDEAQFLERFRGLCDHNQDLVLRAAAALAQAEGTEEKKRQTAAPNNIVKFPIGRIVKKRYYRPEKSPERVEIEAALDSVWGAIKALQRQKQSVLAQLHHCIDRELADPPPGPSVPEGGAA